MQTLALLALATIGCSPRETETQSEVDLGNLLLAGSVLAAVTRGGN